MLKGDYLGTLNQSRDKLGGKEIPKDKLMILLLPRNLDWKGMSLLSLDKCLRVDIVALKKNAED
jgi:hypothetical protein